jgi:putative transposase
MDYRKQAHVTYYADYHLVFVTKYRKKVLKDGMGEYLKEIMKGTVQIFPEVDILTQETDENHIHQLVSIPPKYSVSEIVRYLKGKSAYLMRRKFPFLDKVYYGVGGIWSDGYFVSTVDVNEETIRRYIDRQGLEDSGQVRLEL